MNPVKAGATYIAAYDENNNELARIEIIVLES